jgi:hypothetical protein
MNSIPEPSRAERTKADAECVQRNALNERLRERRSKGRIGTVKESGQVACRLVMFAIRCQSSVAERLWFFVLIALHGPRIT